MRLPLRVFLLAVAIPLGLASMAHASTIYTSDTDLADFTQPVTSYATLSDFSCGDRVHPFTPTAYELATEAARVFCGSSSIPGLPSSNNWILATFASPTSNILVFPNMDDDERASPFDGYQYSIEGSNDGTDWTPLFDAVTVFEEDDRFRLGGFSGTAPLSVNNVVTGGCSMYGCVGYEAHFDYGAAYQIYAFGASTVAFTYWNPLPELSGVGSVPEPSTLMLIALGLGLAGVAGRRKLLT